MARLSRRHFLGLSMGALACAGWGCSRSKQLEKIPGRIVGANAAAGHLLREGKFEVPSDSERVKVVILGAGIAGLAAARQLKARGCDDFLILELEAQPGGTSTSGQNEVSPYPWGAHYLPLPNPEATEVIELLRELGVLQGYTADGLPIYDETMLCADPAERLFDNARWQEGLLPQIGITADDREQYRRFFAQMDEFRDTKGEDGKHAFAIPLDRSSADPRFTVLDRQNMESWLNAAGYTSEPLRWHIDYACRDDFGAGIREISAWAGVHYFASRRGEAAHTDKDSVLTWPEGNGWLVKRLVESIGPRMRTGALTFHVENTGDAVIVDYLDVATKQPRRIVASEVICALPRFVTDRVVAGLPPSQGLQYSPWMVAAVTLNKMPRGRGVALAWDNVMRASDSLGYVVATHQIPEPVPQRTVISHYWPLDKHSPQEARTQALIMTHEQWCELIVNDLQRAHPDIRQSVTNIDVWVWGHGMIRPGPGYIWGDVRNQMSRPHGRIIFAHSDMSGMGLFEEAYTRGVAAAEQVQLPS